jgi:hypothetical protein
MRRFPTISFAGIVSSVSRHGQRSVPAAPRLRPSHLFPMPTRKPDPRCHRRCNDQKEQKLIIHGRDLGLSSFWGSVYTALLRLAEACH